MDFKYVLIVSQYYHSRYSFIVKFDEETFIQKAREFATELNTYKRSKDDNKEMYLGDLEHYVNDEIRRRYNINDAGDIYFILSPYANYCKDEAIQYALDSKRESVGFKRKQILKDIATHHNYIKVKDIIEKYFEIA